MSYLADTSAVWRLSRRRIPEPRPTHVARGLVAMCPPVEAELMTGVRADREYELSSLRTAPDLRLVPGAPRRAA
ncbi:hypothetical protein ABZZ36_06245 [Actinacidiphila glaucinigra]|uniref:hypothetical protein n=1 Tax=Actinacidiphila glaucinigra TaxID=235986 RepID=UPI0033AB5057